MHNTEGHVCCTWKLGTAEIKVKHFLNTFNTYSIILNWLFYRYRAKFLQFLALFKIVVLSNVCWKTCSNVHGL